MTDREIIAELMAALEAVASLTGGQLPDYARAAHDIAMTALVNGANKLSPPCGQVSTDAVQS